MKVVLCNKAEKTYDTSSSRFTISRGGCVATTAPSGDFVLRLKGSGASSRLPGMQFTVEASVSYSMQLLAGRIYLLPTDATVGDPVVTREGSIKGAFANSFGLIGREVHDLMLPILSKPMVYFVAEGCVVPGWIGLGDMPARCETSDGRVRRLGNAEARSEAPEEWVRQFAPLSLSRLVASRPANEQTAQLESRLQAWKDQHAEEASRAIIGIIHPTGGAASCDGARIVNDGDRVALVLDIRWKGGFLGGRYATEVRWVVSPSGHVRATVEKDTAKIPSTPTTRSRLDEYFEKRFYPQIQPTTVTASSPPPTREASPLPPPPSVEPPPVEPVEENPPPPPPEIVDPPAPAPLVVWSYELDKPATKRAFQLQTSPTAKQAKKSTDDFERKWAQVSVRLELTDDGAGALTITSTSPLGGAPAPGPQPITWENREGKIVVLDPKKPGQELVCSTADERQIACSDGKTILVFRQESP
jgi:hypothetical protein